MARYDVHRGNDGHLYLDVQASNLDHLNTRIVIPLMTLDAAPIPVRYLNPLFPIDGEMRSLVTQYMGPVRTASLGRVVASLAHEHDRITAALDRLFSGF